MPRITFEGRRYPMHDHERALDALLRGGAAVHFSCRRGSCHACVLRVVDGDPGEEGRRGLSPAMREAGCFLPCTARPEGDLTAARPDPAALWTQGLVAEHARIGDDVARVTLEVPPGFAWRAGQHVEVRGPDGEARSYSVASVREEDVFVTLYVRRVPGGAVSPWLCDQVRAGDEVSLRGPMGTSFYDDAWRDRPMLLLCTGTGVGPMLAVARDALTRGHRGGIHLVAGARRLDAMLLVEEARALAAAHPTLRVTPCVSRPEGPLPDGVARGRVTDVARGLHADLEGHVVFACGAPDMVYAARVMAVGAGASRDDLRVDPYEHRGAWAPDDVARLAATAPDPEMWAALRGGDGLTELLTDFYGRVYEDPLLAPFFSRVTRQRAIEKQYEFLRGVWTGEGGYLGLNPFNAHHWMVISDALFDHRERLMESCLRRYGLPDALVRRWNAFHEGFRRALVKSSPRGMWVGGVERPADGWLDETVTVATVCDGCACEMPVGAQGRMHARTGELYCGACEARRVGSTVRPAPVAAE